MISPLAPAVRIINDALEPAVLGLLSDVPLNAGISSCHLTVEGERSFHFPQRRQL